MQKIFLLFGFFFFILCHETFSQIDSIENLIPNSGFEEGLFEAPIKKFNQIKQEGIAIARGWTQPTKSTADLWNSNESKARFHKKMEIEAIPKARSGKGRIGLCLNYDNFFAVNKKGYGEYAQCRLLNTMEEQQLYYFECYVFLDKSSKLIAHNIGVYFSDSSFTQSRFMYMKLKPQIVITDEKKLNAKGQWVKLSGSYLARGGEKFMTVGCFAYKGACIHHKRLRDASKKKNRYSIAYYYFDDFLLFSDPRKDSVVENVSPEYVTLLVDNSASMYKGGYIKALKKEVGNFIQSSSQNARIDLITFGSGIKTRCSRCYFSDSTQWNNLINTFHPAGATNIGRAIERGFELADSANVNGLRNRVVLFTDARFELDKKTSKIISTGVSAYDIQFHLIQFGDFYNKELEKAIVKSGGEYVQHNTKSIHEVLSEKQKSKCGNELVRQTNWSTWRKQRIRAFEGIGAGALLLLLFLI